MNKVFKYPVAYRVKNQTEVDELKKLLFDLGYIWEASKDNDWDKYPFLLTKYSSMINGSLGFYNSNDNCELIDSKELFIALASMVDSEEFFINEYYTCISNSMSVKAGEIYKLIKIGNSTSTWINLKDGATFSKDKLTDYWEKSSKEELVQYFNKQTTKKVKEELIFNTWKKGDNLTDRIVDVKAYCKLWENSDTTYSTLTFTTSHQVIKSEVFKGEEHLCLDLTATSKSYWMIPKSELIRVGLIKETIIKEDKMNKKFKNTIAVTGSQSLLKAFVEELELLGYTKSSINTYDSRRNYVLTYKEGTYGYHTHTGHTTATYDIPTEWNKALELASEVVKEELVFEIGKWYVYTASHYNNCLVNFQGDKYKNNYGFWESRWHHNLSMETLAYPKSNWRLATKEEVETTLIKEATKRGFVKGANINNSNLGYSASSTIYSTTIHFEYDRLVADYIYIFEKGKWAEILPSTPAIKINGYVAQFKDSSIKFGCNEIKLEFIREVYRLQTEQKIDFSSYTKEIKQIVEYYKSPLGAF